MSFSVAGKTAIVTGAANGVGLAIARHLLDAGANVVLRIRMKHVCEMRWVISAMEAATCVILLETCVRN